jgi:hypothetical protein
VAFYERERARFAVDRAAADALLASDPAAAASAPATAKRAALTMVANVLLSLDATLTKE